MSPPRAKSPPSRAPAPAKAPDTEAVPAAVPLTPVGRRIGEGAGNLQARGEAFRRRHGTAK